MPILRLKNSRDNTQLICNISELSGLFTKSTSLETFLQQIVDMIAQHMKSDVCSIYLYYEDTQELVMKANVGLNQKSVNNIRLKLGEGLTGLALKEFRPICERNASKNANFRYFPGLGEEQYESFLAVPIIRGTTMIGTIVIQNTSKNYFTDEDVVALRAVSSQLANTIELTRLILAMEEKKDVGREMSLPENLKFIKGKSGSPGFAFAEAVVFTHESELTSYAQDNFLKGLTLTDFHRAVENTEKQLEAFQKSIEEKLSDVASLIFTAQILMLKDRAFIEAIEDGIHNGLAPPQAIIKIVNTYIKKFESLSSSYLQEKSHDVRDIGRRLLENLVGKANTMNVQGRILITRELFPSDILKLSSEAVKGVILLSGGATSHLSILAQSLQIPLVIIDVVDLLSLPQKTPIILDADQGNIYINPTEEILNTFKDRNDASVLFKKLQKKVTATTQTADGKRITLMANINLLGDLKNARDFKAEGIGLYRTEFPFIVRSDFPTEEEQYVIYKKVVDGMRDKEITFRTLDIGGDKMLSYFEHHLKEKNPYLGMRSIRFSLKHIDIFSQQIRAILRAGADANIRLMFPMISSVEEFIRAKEITLDCVKSLKEGKIPCHENPQIGLMIELPSVLEMIDELAQEADFFSIGTNDFIQYMLAVDRTNEKVADLYLPYHPAILRAMKKVVDAGLRHQIDVSICGDMVHDEKYLKYFLGAGVTKFSLNPIFLPKIQSAIKKIHTDDAQKVTEKILGKTRLDDISSLLK